jgi:hypothetical protein
MRNNITELNQDNNSRRRKRRRRRRRRSPRDQYNIQKFEVLNWLCGSEPSQTSITAPRQQVAEIDRLSSTTALLAG